MAPQGPRGRAVAAAMAAVRVVVLNALVIGPARDDTPVRTLLTWMHNPAAPVSRR